MAETAASLVSKNPFEFKKSATFLKGAADVGIVFDAKDSQAIVNALQGNTAFPPGTLHFGTVAASASAKSGDIPFDGGQGTVSFSAGGTARGGK